LHLFVVPIEINHALVTGVALLAFWRGGWRERLLSGAQVAYFIFPQRCASLACPPAEFHRLAAGVLLQDGVQLVLCLACLMGAARYWVVWAGAFALLSLVTDAIAFSPRGSYWSGAAADAVWMYGANAAILYGAWTCRRNAVPAAT
jgi:hypothetical protein